MWFLDPNSEEIYNTLFFLPLLVWGTGFSRGLTKVSEDEGE